MKLKIISHLFKPQMCMGEGGKTPLVFKLDCRWKWVVMFRPLYPREGARGTHWIGDCWCPRTGLNISVSCIRKESNHDSSIFQAITNMPTELSMMEESNKKLKLPSCLTQWSWQSLSCSRLTEPADSSLCSQEPAKSRLGVTLRN